MTSSSSFKRRSFGSFASGAALLRPAGVVLGAAHHDRQVSDRCYPVEAPLAGLEVSATTATGGAAGAAHCVQSISRSTIRVPAATPASGHTLSAACAYVSACWWTGAV